MNETEHIPWVILLVLRIGTYLEYFWEDKINVVCFYIRITRIFIFKY